MTSGDEPNPITGSNNATLAPISIGIPTSVENQTSCAAPLEICCVPYYSCGMSYPPVSNAPVPNSAQGQAPYGGIL